MPCRDYWADEAVKKKRQARLDMLARCACNAMNALETVMVGIQTMDPSMDIAKALVMAGVS